MKPVQPPQSCPARSTGSVDPESVEEGDQVVREDLWVVAVRAGASVQPNPRRSGQITRWLTASGPISFRHIHQCWGQPWTSSSGGPEPASATWVRSPPALTKRCSTPGTSGRARSTGESMRGWAGREAPACRSSRNEAGDAAMSLRVSGWLAFGSWPRRASRARRARLFVALDLPDEVREGIVAWQGRELTDPALRPVRPESLHMTLVFLGYHPEKAIERIAEAALNRGPGAQDPARARAGRGAARKASTPVRARRPFGGSGGSAVAGGAAAGRGALLRAREAAILAPSDHRAGKAGEAWRPQAGLGGEVRQGGSRTAVLRPFLAVRLTLYRSHLRPQGAEYIPIAVKDLKPAESTTER